MGVDRMTMTMDAPKMARNDLSVKIDAELVKKAKYVAIDRDTTLAEYLSEILRPAVEKDFKEVIAKLSPDASKTKTKGSK
jgi:hypothetical protein